MVYKRIILIENKSQAEEYLKHKEKFKDATPITFDFPLEETLLNANVKFKTEEEYETETIYKGIYDVSLENTNEICGKIKINYRGIDMFQLFYEDLFKFLGVARRYLRLLENIEKKEKISKVILLKNKCNSDPKEEICLKIAKKIFREKIRIMNYEQKKEENNLLIRIAGFIQNNFSKVRLSVSKKKENKIFFCGHKAFYEPLIKELLKNKKNKMFRCQDRLQKSFFIDKKIIPFYEFSEKKNVHQEELMRNIKEFLNKKEKFQFLKEIKIEKEIIFVLEDWLTYYIQKKFIYISGIINHIIKLMKKRKINCIVLFADNIVFEKVFAQVGKLFNIPSIVLLNGLVGRGVYPSVCPLSSKYILVFGKGSKKILMNFGVQEKKILITGSPQFDKYFNEKILKSKKIKRREIVFIVSGHPSKNPSPEIHLTKKIKKDIFRMLFKALKKFPEYKLVIKGRRGWDMNNLPQMIANQAKYNIDFVEEIDPIKLLSSAEIVITTNTTMALDALLLNKPVISIWFKNMERFSGYKDSKAIKTVYNQRQLEQAIRICKKKQTEKDKLGREKYLEHELFKLDGKSSKRVETIINKLCSIKNEAK